MWSNGHVMTDVSLALPWVVVGSDVLRSRTGRQEKSVFNRSSYEVGVRQSACRGGPRWVHDSDHTLLWDQLNNDQGWQVRMNLVFNQSSYEVRACLSACWRGQRWVHDRIGRT